MKIYNVDALPHSELISSATGEAFSKSALLSELFAHQDIFVHHEILPPGRRSSSPHRHTLREEMIFVLKGRPTAREIKPFNSSRAILSDLTPLRNTCTLLKMQLQRMLAFWLFAQIQPTIELSMNKIFKETFLILSSLNKLTLKLCWSLKILLFG